MYIVFDWACVVCTCKYVYLWLFELGNLITVLLALILPVLILTLVLWSSSDGVRGVRLEENSNLLPAL